MERAQRQIGAVRSFNRLWTRQLGLFGRGLLGSSYSLAQVRVLREIAHGSARCAAADIARELAMDAGQMSRLVAELGRRGLVKREPGAGDRRRVALALTRKGQRVFADLDARANQQIAALLAPLSHVERDALVGAMSQLERKLSPAADAPREPVRSVVLRGPRPGELGWVVERHGALYAQEYGWDWTFEALVARIVADFVDTCDPERERCFVADLDGAPVGSVFVVAHSATVAQLRLLLVEPGARGLGVGGRLVDEVTRFARAAGYRTIRLWTNDVLVAARRLYQRAGYRLVGEERHTSFGKRLVGQTWELSLRPGRPARKRAGADGGA